MAHRPLPHADPHAPRGCTTRAILRLLASPPTLIAERSLPFRVIVWRLVPRLMRLTGGRAAAVLPFPAAVIETRDARNGRPHRRTVIYFHDREQVIVVASKGGMASDPHWYENAVADPDVRFADRPYRAEPITDGDEHARLHRLADAAYPATAAYRRQAARSGRTIPILRLRPR